MSNRLTSSTQDTHTHMSPTWILAIDFGTSNSAAAHSGATSGSIETLSLSHTSNLMPSSVYVAAPDRISVGEPARNLAQQNPTGFVASPKRLITGAPTTVIAGYTMPSALPVAAVMSAIISRGKAAHAGQLPTQVVLTHPEAWAPQQVGVLVEAAMRAGIDGSRISTISEPRAAAAHYSRSHAMQPGARIAVFDFGGGTLDIAVLTVTGPNAFQVIAARGDNGLGGKNIDALIQRWVEQRLADRDPELVEWLRRRAPVDVVQSLQESIRSAKELLSEAPSATITINNTPQGRQTLQITRDEFDELIAPAAEQALRLTRATLLDAGITHPEQLTALYLTGGSSRIPLIQQRLGEVGPVATLDDPKTVVAQGALVTAVGDRGVDTRERPAAPTAAELMTPPTQQAPGGRYQSGASQAPPGQQRVAPTPSPTPASSGGRKWGRLALIGVAVVALIGIVVGGIALVNRSSGDDNPNQAAGSSTAAAQTAANGSAIITDEKQLYNLLPSALQDGVEDCRKSDFTQSGALTLMCNIKKDGSLASFFAKQSYGGIDGFISFYSDSTKVQSTITSLRNGTLSNGKGTLVEDSARLSAAEIADDTPAKSATANYANTYNNLGMTIFELASIDDGKTFMSRSGLIS